MTSWSSITSADFRNNGWFGTPNLSEVHPALRNAPEKQRPAPIPEVPSPTMDNEDAELPPYEAVESAKPSVPQQPSNPSPAPHSRDPSTSSKAPAPAVNAPSDTPAGDAPIEQAVLMMSELKFEGGGDKVMVVGSAASTVDDSAIPATTADAAAASSSAANRNRAASATGVAPPQPTQWPLQPDTAAAAANPSQMHPYRQPPQATRQPNIPHLQPTWHGYQDSANLMSPSPGVPMSAPAHPLSPRQYPLPMSPPAHGGMYHPGQPMSPMHPGQGPYAAPGAQGYPFSPNAYQQQYPHSAYPMQQPGSPMSPMHPGYMHPMYQSMPRSPGPSIAGSLAEHAPFSPLHSPLNSPGLAGPMQYTHTNPNAVSQTSLDSTSTSSSISRRTSLPKPTGKLRSIFKTPQHPLIEAAKINDANEVWRLLAPGDTIQHSPTATDREGWTSLHWAARLNHHESSRAILMSVHRDDGVPGCHELVELRTRDKRDLSPLQLAAISNAQQITTVLLQYGANPNAQCPQDGATALHRAAQEGHDGMIALLVRCGALVDRKDLDGMPPLMWATQAKRLSAAHVLINAGANLEMRLKVGETQELGPRDGLTVLCKAVAAGNMDFARLFLERGADPDADSPGGMRPLHRAAARGDAAMIRALIEYHATLTLLSEEGYTALHHAARNGHKAACDALKDAGADESATTRDGLTPRALAAKHGFEGVV